MNNKKIFVCSPLRGDYDNNMKRAEEYCKLVIDTGNTPYAPHLFFTRFLDDNIESERVAGINGGINFLSVCDELWYFGDIITDGMKQEIDFCNNNNIPTLHYTIGD